jgi:hypothetical protein
MNCHTEVVQHYYRVDRVNAGSMFLRITSDKWTRAEFPVAFSTSRHMYAVYVYIIDT